MKVGNESLTYIVDLHSVTMLLVIQEQRGFHGGQGWADRDRPPIGGCLLERMGNSKKTIH